MTRRDDRDPGLPIKLGPCSNGEFVPPRPSDLVLEAVRRARTRSDDHARRLGVSRRDFLVSTMGAATVLGALSACVRDRQPDGATPGGTFDVPPEAELDPGAAEEALGGDDFVFDLQTHFLDGNHDIPDLGISDMFPQQACGEDDPRDCFSVDRFLDLVFNQSDTAMIVISALPFAGSPLNPEVMASTIDLADRVGCTGRVLVQGEAHPTLGVPARALDNMAQLRADLPISAWKVYTHLGGPGWWLDDHDASAPQVGDAFIRQAAELGPPIIAVHKGFGSGSPYADPVDVGPAAARHRDVRFLVYHSGFDLGVDEGPYDDDRPLGVDRLIASARATGIGPGENVYAELGSTWRMLMGDPESAAHVLGKLLVAFGEDNVVWGTDSIWYGSPQDQIQAFRAFEISEELQERHGYPALTPTLKAKVLGGNAARLHGVEPVTGGCRFDPSTIEGVTLAAERTNATLGPRTARQVRAVQDAHLASLRWHV